MIIECPACKSRLQIESTVDEDGALVRVSILDMKAETQNNTPGKCMCKTCNCSDSRTCEIARHYCCTFVRLIRTHDQRFTSGEELQPK